MYRRERLHNEQLRHAHAARLGDAANIIAHQIDNHQVFSAIFRRGRQRLRLLAVGVSIGKARQGALDRAGLNNTVSQMNKTLRRKAEDGAVFKA